MRGRGTGGGAGGAAAMRAASSLGRQHFLYLVPEPQGHGPFRLGADTTEPYAVTLTVEPRGLSSTGTRDPRVHRPSPGALRLQREYVRE